MVGEDFLDSGEVKRTRATGTRSLHDVKVDHGGGDVRVAHQVLDGADVGSALEEMGGKGMTHAMGGGRFRDACLSHGGLELPLHGCFMEMVAGDLPGPGMGA